MVDMSSWLARKYDILGQQANSADLLAKSQARLTDTQAQLAPGEARARNQAAFGQAAAGFGQATLSNANAEAVPGLASSEIAQRRGAAELSGAQAAGEIYSVTPDAGLGQNVQDRTKLGVPFGSTSGFPNFSLSSPSAAVNVPGAVTSKPIQAAEGTSILDANGNTRAYSTGTAKVPGTGDGKTDTQQAMLAPGEAVLNKAAAEHLGRTTIELLNAIGEQKMGLAGPQTTEDDRAQSANDPKNGYAKGTSNVPGYAKGTAKVPAKGAAKPAAKAAGGKGAKPGGDATAQISPKLLAALMQGAGGGGAGMPPAGGQPMPMPMPQVAPPQGGGM